VNEELNGLSQRGVEWIQPTGADQSLCAQAKREAKGLVTQFLPSLFRLLNMLLGIFAAVKIPALPPASRVFLSQ
jgi:hypothetical protein